MGMTFSFIVTSWNIEDYISSCLHSLAACLRPGDQLIIVDDGSDDRTCEEIEACFDMLSSRGADILSVFLGTNTQGGVGIPANIGLAEATGEAIFVVDGDDFASTVAVEVA